MVANNVGITLLPKMAVDAGIAANVAGISTAEISGQNIKRGIGLIWRNKSPRVNDYLLFAKYLTR
jgi:LysR family transcriptional regulator, hydrogen peroxide-inducible genes activator